MLKRGDNAWNNAGIRDTGSQHPDESILRSIAEAVTASRGVGKKFNTNLVNILNITSISWKPHSTHKNTSIINFTAEVSTNRNQNADRQIPISVLMKKADASSSVELQAYSTLFKDLQPDTGRNTHSNILYPSEQNGNLYNLIPRAYHIQKPYLFLENLEHSTAGEFKSLQQGSFGRKVNALNLDFNHCLLAVETLARFHATSYTLRRQLGVKGKGKLEMLQKYPFLNQHSTMQHYSSRMSSQLTPVFEQAFDLAVKVIQQENPSLAFKLQRKVINPEGIFDKVVKLLEEEKYDNDDFYVVCHGNFLADGLLYSYDQSNKNEEPTACRITNFNSVFFGPLASDLAMFLLTSTSLEFRLEFEEKLLAFYCDAFQEELVARHGRNSVIVEEFGENIDEFHRKVEKQYKKMMEFAFYNICVLLPLILFTSSNDSTDNNNGDNTNTTDACSSIKDLLEGNASEKYFPREGSIYRKESEFEKFVLDNDMLKERFIEILKQLAKCRVIL